MPYRNRSHQIAPISVSTLLNALEDHAGIMGNPHGMNHRRTGFEEPLS